MTLVGDDDSWLRDGGKVIAATPPGGYAEFIATLIDALRSSPVWDAWWAQAELDFLVLRQGYYARYSQDTDVLSRRLRRRNDHVVAAFTVVFDPEETRAWSLAEAERSATRDVRVFFEELARRLRLPPAPAMPAQLATGPELG